MPSLSTLATSLLVWLGGQAPPEPPRVAPLTLAKTDLAGVLPPAVTANYAAQTIEWSHRNRKLAARLMLVPGLQQRMRTVLEQAHGDYAAVAAIDANLGALRVLVSRSPASDAIPPLALRGTFPAASVFKLVTAAAAIDAGKANPGSVYGFRGGNHELYHFSLVDKKAKRTLRRMSLREAFAHSVNPVFALLGLDVLEPRELRDYAQRFGFGEKLPADFPVGVGNVVIPEEKAFSLGETAAGYNWNTQMSVVQGAMLGATTAMDGAAMEPFVVETVMAADGELLYQATPRKWKQVLQPGAARAVRELMRETVKRGTAASSFAGFREPGVEVGGKTGTLQSMAPRGRCDWFAGYAQRGSDRLGFAALVVHTKPGQVKAAAIARALVESYFHRDRGDKPADITFRNADFIEVEE